MLSILQSHRDRQTQVLTHSLFPALQNTLTIQFLLSVPVKRNYSEHTVSATLTNTFFKGEEPHNLLTDQCLHHFNAISNHYLETSSGLQC
jgi:hypothetical protein